MTEKTPRPTKRPKPSSKNPGRAERRSEPTRSATANPSARRAVAVPRGIRVPSPSVEPRPPSAVPEPRRAEPPLRAEPEILVAIAPAGRETLDAIASELAPKRPLRSPVRPRAESMPEITIHQTAAGRDTLAAINEELADNGRDTLPTLPYGDRVPNAPGAVTPSRPPHTEPRERAVPTRPKIFEMRTFVVERVDAESLADESARLDFVMKELAHRLPGGSASGVTRVDMTPWTEPETLILRVWCRVSDPA